MTVIAPLSRVKQASGKSATVVDDIAAYLGLLIACQLAIPQVPGLALAEELIIGLTVHTPGLRVTVLQDVASSIWGCKTLLILDILTEINTNTK